MSGFLEQKKILFFTQHFFDYETVVIREMQRQGAVVHFYDERANVGSIGKIIIKLAPFLIQKKISTYYESICENEKKFSPDYVLFITTTIVSEKDILLMKKYFPNALFILHLWDSLKNTNALKLYKLFDRSLSFDDSDCEKYGFIFRPNFFVPIKRDKNIKVEKKYDFVFIGTLHSDRPKILYMMEQIFKDKGYSYYYYLYFPGKLLKFLMYIFNGYVRKLDKKNIHTTALERSEVKRILDESLYIIDVNHPKQNGLTMRPFDMLYYRRKILTADDSIKKYDFYREQNQLVFNRQDGCFDDTKISDEYENISPEILNEYSLENWLYDIFFLNKNTKKFLF